MSYVRGLPEAGEDVYICQAPVWKASYHKDGNEWAIEGRMSEIVSGYCLDACAFSSDDDIIFIVDSSKGCQL